MGIFLGDKTTLSLPKRRRSMQDIERYKQLSYEYGIPLDIIIDIVSIMKPYDENELIKILKNLQDIKKNLRKDKRE